jgi:hypothetical protein
MTWIFRAFGESGRSVLDDTVNGFFRAFGES